MTGGAPTAGLSAVLDLEGDDVTCTVVVALEDAAAGDCATEGAALEATAVAGGVLMNWPSMSLEQTVLPTSRMIGP